MKALQLQEGKQQFSAVAERAAGGKPQIVTKHGKPLVVIVGINDWLGAKPVKKRTLLAALQSCPGEFRLAGFPPDPGLPA